MNVSMSMSSFLYTSVQYNKETLLYSMQHSGALSKTKIAGFKLLRQHYGA